MQQRIIASEIPILVFFLFQFSHASGSKQLSDKFLYPLFFRVIGGFTDDQPPKYLQFMKRFGYKHVAILYEIGEYYQPVRNFLNSTKISIFTLAANTT